MSGRAITVRCEAVAGLERDRGGDWALEEGGSEEQVALSGSLEVRRESGGTEIGGSVSQSLSEA